MHKLRLKFSKKGPVRFIGHLDLMRYMQKVNRRAEIDIRYSEGFSPHQILSFAQPLSVGAESDGEYMDMTLNSMTSTEDLVNKLNSVMNEGIKILAAVELPERSDKAMTSVAAAEYLISFREGKEPSCDIKEAFSEYMSHDRLPAMKKTKAGEKEIDMKPLVYRWDITEDNKIHLLLSAGSANNLKASLLIQQFLSDRGEETPEFGLIVHRVDTYIAGSDEKGSYVEPMICVNEKDKEKRFYLS